MNAVLFCRVSSKEQEEMGYSLPSQQKLLSEYASRKGYQVAKVFLVSESASGKTERQEFNKMLTFVDKKHIKIIVCEKVDRLTRNLRDIVAIYNWLENDSERQIHFVKDSLILHKESRSQEKLNLDMRVVFAKNYTDNLSEEVKKGQKEKLEQGWLPSKPKLGYKNLDVNGHKIHVIDESKASLLRKAFEIYATGTHSVERLSNYLYKEGLRTHQGNKLVISRLHAILSDPYYISLIVWNGKEYPAKHEPLISKELFQKVQYRLRSKTTMKYQKHFFLFRALLRCGECGGTITWERQKGIAYGHCTRYKPCSQKKWTKEDDLDNQILFSLELLQIRNERIREWIRKALHESNKEVFDYHEAILQELNQKLIAIDKRLSNLYDDKVDGIISKEFYEKKTKEYEKEQTEISESIAKHEKAGNKYRKLGLQFYEVSQNAKEIYLKKLKKYPEKKRLLLGLIFAKMELKGTVLTYEYTKGFKILAKLIELINKRSKVDENPQKDNNTFVQEEKIDKSSKTAQFCLQYPEVRRRQDSNLREPFNGLRGLATLRNGPAMRLLPANTTQILIGKFDCRSCKSRNLYNKA